MPFSAPVGHRIDAVKLCNANDVSIGAVFRFKNRHFVKNVPTKSGFSPIEKKNLIKNWRRSFDHSIRCQKIALRNISIGANI
jgi:hypothetical protein